MFETTPQLLTAALTTSVARLPQFCAPAPFLHRGRAMAAAPEEAWRNSASSDGSRSVSFLVFLLLTTRASKPGEA